MDGDGESREAEFVRREALCRRCGLCCHRKARLGDVVVITELCCEFLDPETNACRVYPERALLQPLCLTAEASAADGTLPGDCPYVRGIEGYAAPLLLWEHPEFEAAVNRLYPERAAGKMTRAKAAALKYGRGGRVRKRGSGGGERRR